MAEDFSDLEHRTYKEVQGIARDLSLDVVGKTKDELVAAISAAVAVPSEGGSSSDVLFSSDGEDGVEEISNITTTKNIGKGNNVEEIMPKRLDDKVKLVKVKLRKNMPRSTIGNQVWELKAGKLYEVPENVAVILSECGYL